MVRPSPERGFALLLALAVLLLVAAAVLLAFRTALSGKNAVQRERRLIELRAGSDAALAETMAALDEDSEFPGFSGRAFAGATLSSEITRRPDGTLHLLTTAARGGWAMALEATVRLDRRGKPAIVSWNRSPAHPARRSTGSVLR